LCIETFALTRRSYDRMCAAIDTILSLQNPTGGFASYELVRGSPLLELP
jgi:lanosterol synthase